MEGISNRQAGVSVCRPFCWMSADNSHPTNWEEDELENIKGNTVWVYIPVSREKVVLQTVEPDESDVKKIIYALNMMNLMFHYALKKKRKWNNLILFVDADMKNQM